MVWYLFVSVFGAFGLFCALWAAFGCLLVCRVGWILCPGCAGGPGFVPVYLWLRGVGILNCPLILADLGLSETERRAYTEKGIEICSLAELPGRLPIGAE